MSSPPRIYTRSGDDGTTGLVGGRRVSKRDARIEAYGTVDELSSAIGLARAALAEELPDQPEVVEERGRRLDAWLAWTQDVLFNLGSELATPPESARPGAPSVTGDDALALETAIDAAQAELEPLRNFIHPGGSLPGAFLHQARTVARRAERRLIALSEVAAVSEEGRVYLNRLSDALFVWSRWINAAMNRPEHLWDSASRPPSR